MPRIYRNAQYGVEVQNMPSLDIMTCFFSFNEDSEASTITILWYQVINDHFWRTAVQNKSEM